MCPCNGGNAVFVTAPECELEIPYHFVCGGQLRCVSHHSSPFVRRQNACQI